MLIDTHTLPIGETIETEVCIVGARLADYVKTIMHRRW